MINYIKTKSYYPDYVEVRLSPTDAIETLNKRLNENGVGYIFQDNKIIKIDSVITHVEIVKPALKLISNKLFENVSEEYLKAHDHYRHGRNKECIGECLKALESTLKIIMVHKQWKYEEKDTSSKLLQKCFENELIPKYLQAHFSGLEHY